MLVAMLTMVTVVSLVSLVSLVTVVTVALWWRRASLAGLEGWCDVLVAVVTLVVNVVTVVTLANVVGNGNQCFNVVGNVVSVTKEGSLVEHLWRSLEAVGGGSGATLAVGTAQCGHYQGQAVLQGGRCSQVMQY